MRTTLLLLLLVAAACNGNAPQEPTSGNLPGEPPASDAASPGDPVIGSDAAALDVEVDESQLGSRCEDSDQCSGDARCLYYPNVEGARCVSGSACSPVTCPSGYNCRVQASSPGAVGCVKE